jgi:23S rRNA pseudouridine1911/1915/1917 synthase
VSGLVPADLDGERADKVVAVLAGVSRSVARRLVEQGGARIDGRRLRPDERLAGGASIELDELLGAPDLEPEVVPFEVIHSDAHLLVVDKPPGVVVHPGAGRRRGTLAAGLLEAYPELAAVGEPGRAGLVHRLDADTSGVLLVARTPEAHRALRAALSRREIRRTYLTLVRGVPNAPSGTVDAPLDRDPRHPTRRAVSAGGKPAKTHYKVLASWAEVALLEVELETGRTHQIRVHLAAIGHPVVGDRTYGVPSTEGRMFLHAWRLSLAHPATGERIELTAPLPEDLRCRLEDLGPPTHGALPEA